MEAPGVLFFLVFLLLLIAAMSSPSDADACPGNPPYGYVEQPDR